MTATFSDPIHAPGDANRYAAAAREALSRGDAEAAELAARAAGGAAGYEGWADTDNPFDPTTHDRLHSLWAWHRQVGVKAAREARAKGQADLFTPPTGGNAA